MCIFPTPEVQNPRMPVEYAAQKAPTRQQAAGAADRMRDRLRAASGTILTGSSGISSAVDTTGKKTLLGA